MSDWASSGVGILSTPYALSKGGWLVLLLLFLIAFVCYYTGVILIRCMNSNPSIRTYPDIGRAAFGRMGSVTISIFLYLELFLVAVAFLIMEADNVHNLVPRKSFHIFGKEIGGKKVFVLLTGLVVLPSTWWKSLRILSYVSATGVTSAVILVFIVLWGGAFDGIGFHKRGELWNWSGLTTAISLFTFCYLGHAVFPEIRNSMKKKTQFPKVLLVCFILTTLSYVSMSILGYIMFGEHLTSQVTLNMPKKNVSTKIVICMTLILPISKYAMIVGPIATKLEETFPFQDTKMRSCIIRTCLVISTVIVAMMVPYFSLVMAFIGAFVGTALSILFPCLCYWKIILGVRKSRTESIIILIIVLIGTFVALLGTSDAVRNIIKEVRAS